MKEILTQWERNFLFLDAYIELEDRDDRSNDSILFYLFREPLFLYNHKEEETFR